MEPRTRITILMDIPMCIRDTSSMVTVTEELIVHGRIRSWCWSSGHSLQRPLPRESTAVFMVQLQSTNCFQPLQKRFWEPPASRVFNQLQSVSKLSRQRSRVRVSSSPPFFSSNPGPKQSLRSLRIANHNSSRHKIGRADIIRDRLRHQVAERVDY